MESKIEDEVIQQLEMEEPESQDTPQLSGLCIFVKTAYCILVAFMGLGLGFSISTGTLVYHWDCYSNKTSIIIDPTDTESMKKSFYETGFYNGHMLTSSNCYGSIIYPLFISVIFLSGLVSSLGCLCFNFGSKWVLVLSNALFTLGFGLNYRVMSSQIQAIFARIFQGMGSGLMLCTMVSFFEDNSPKKMLNFLKIFGPVCITIGALINNLFGMFEYNSIHDYSFFYLFYACLFGLFTVIMAFFPTKKTSITRIKSSVQSVTPFVTKIKENCKALITVFLLHSGQQLCLFNAIFMYATDVFKDSLTNGELLAVGVKIGPAIMAGCMVSSSLISAFIGFFVKDMRYLYFISHISTIVCLGALATNFQPALVSCIFVFFFSLGLGPLVWVMTPEYFKSNFRREGIIFGTAVNMLFSFIVTFACKWLKTYGITQFLYVGSIGIMTLYLFLLLRFSELNKDCRRKAS